MATQVETELCHEYIKSGSRCFNKAKITRIDCKRVCGIHKNIKKEKKKDIRLQFVEPHDKQPEIKNKPDTQKIDIETYLQFAKYDNIKYLKALLSDDSDSSDDSDDEFQTPYEF